jgi:hypothetical protein
MRQCGKAAARPLARELRRLPHRSSRRRIGKNASSERRGRRRTAVRCTGSAATQRGHFTAVNFTLTIWRASRFSENELRNFPDDLCFNAGIAVLGESAARVSGHRVGELESTARLVGRMDDRK